MNTIWIVLIAYITINYTLFLVGLYIERKTKKFIDLEMSNVTAFLVTMAVGLPVSFFVIPIVYFEYTRAKKAFFTTKQGLFLPAEYVGEVEKGYHVIYARKRLAIVKNEREIWSADLVHIVQILLIVIFLQSCVASNCHNMDGKYLKKQYENALSKQIQ